MNILWLMTFWNWLFMLQSRFKHDRSKSAVWNRAGDIVMGLPPLRLMPHTGTAHANRYADTAELYQTLGGCGAPIKGSCLL